MRVLLAIFSVVSAWENLSIQRAYTIKDALVYEKVTIQAKHNFHKPQDSYIFTVPLGERPGHVQGSYSGANLETSEIDDGEYRIKFPDVVPSGTVRKFEVTMILGHALKAAPSRTNILEPNAVEFEFPLAPKFMYPTRTQEISVSGFGQLLSYGPESLSLHGNFLTTKISDSEDFPASPGVVSFMHAAALEFVASARRQVYVSHFGEISVSDDLEVKNEAASLRGEFSRIPFAVREQMGDKSPFKVDGYSEALTAIFSKYASNIHYFDVIGNISSSSARRSANEKYIAAELQPRFPLLGGWRTEFSLSQSLPTSKTVDYDEETGKFTLAVSFNHPLVKYFTDSLAFEVLLPEGAYDVQVQTPRRIVQEPSTRRRDWMDTPIIGGHTVVRFRSASPFIIPEKEALNYNFTVTYRLSTFAHIRPALLLVFYFVVALTALGTVARLTSGEPLPDSSPATPAGGSPTAAQTASRTSSPGFVVVQPGRPAATEVPAQPAGTQAGLKKRK